MPPSPSPRGAGPFVDVPVRDRFFQSSAFFPMPIVLLSTREPDGRTNLAPYSLCFPHVTAAGHQMVVVCQERSKTAQNLRRSGRVALNFIPDDPALLASAKLLSRPLPTAEKMVDSVFTLVAAGPSAAIPPEAPGHAGGEPLPELVAEAVQVFECSLLRAEPDDAPGEQRFVLRIDRIRMQPRWFEALEGGKGAPKLPVDYGLRKGTDSWLSRPRARVSGPRLRPRFEISVARPAADVIAAFRDALDRPDAPIAGVTRGEYLQLALPPEQRTTWSPHLDLRVESTDEGTSVVRGRIGPHPQVWTLFTGLHLLVAFSGLGGLMWGLSQHLANEPAWALWAVPIALFLNAFIAGAAFIGQGLGADQTYQLRSFLDDVLET